MSTLLSLLSGFRRGKARRAAARTLHGLSAAQLADIGIPPDRIEDVVDEMLVLNEHRASRPALATRAGYGHGAVTALPRWS
jgi:hypothetical protein